MSSVGVIISRHCPFEVGSGEGLKERGSSLLASLSRSFALRVLCLESLVPLVREGTL